MRGYAWQLVEPCPECLAAAGSRCVVAHAGQRASVRALPVGACHPSRVAASGSRMVARAAGAVVVVEPVATVDPRQMKLPGTE